MDKITRKRWDLYIVYLETLKNLPPDKIVNGVEYIRVADYKKKTEAMFAAKRLHETCGGLKTLVVGRLFTDQIIEEY